MPEEPPLEEMRHLLLHCCPLSAGTISRHSSGVVIGDAACISVTFRLQLVVEISIPNVAKWRKTVANGRDF